MTHVPSPALLYKTLNSKVRYAKSDEELFTTLSQFPILDFDTPQRVKILSAALERLWQLEGNIEMYKEYTEMLSHAVYRLSAKYLRDLLISYPGKASDVAKYHIINRHVTIDKDLFVMVSNLCPGLFADLDLDTLVAGLPKGQLFTALVALLCDKSDSVPVKAVSYVNSLGGWTEGEFSRLLCCLVRSPLALESALEKWMTLIEHLSLSPTAVATSIVHGTFGVLLKHGVNVYNTDRSVIISALGRSPDMLRVAIEHAGQPETVDFEILVELAAQTTRFDDCVAFKKVMVVLELLDWKSSVEVYDAVKQATLQYVNVKFLLRAIEECPVLWESVKTDEDFVVQLALSANKSDAELLATTVGVSEAAWITLNLPRLD
jgi:hypothetical protein